MGMAYDILKETKHIEIIKIQNCAKAHPFNAVILTVIFKDTIVGEIEIRAWQKPALYFSNKFLSELEQADSFFNFKYHILKQVNELADEGKVYYNDAFEDKRF